jgi:PAS domain S-box-containing protein
MNGSAAGLFGMTPEQVIGKTQWDLFPKEIADVQAKNTRRVIREGIEFREETKTIVGKEWRWFDVNLQPYKNSRGKTVAAMIIAIDITEQKKNMEALQTSEDQYRLLIDNVQADISILDYNGVFLFINDAIARSMKAEAKDIIGRNQSEFFSKEAAKVQLRNIRNVIRGKKEFREETKVLIGGDWRWFDVNVQPYYDLQGDDTAALIIAIDITNQKEVETALRESEECFRRQFDSLPIPAYTWEYSENDFTLVGCNKAAYSITHDFVKNYLGTSASKMYASTPDVTKDMHRCLKEKTSVTREMTYKFMTSNELKHLIVHYVYAPPNTVVVHTEDMTEQKNVENAIKKAHAELETRVKKRTEELAEANEALKVEREALNQKNIAMREVLDQIEDGKRQMASQIQSNINSIVLPILKSLESKTSAAGKNYIGLLHSSLNDIASPLISTLESTLTHLTPRELEICNMIKSGLSSKEIAETFNTSIQTVLKQRTIIRRKLGISNRRENLASYLKALE